MTPSTGQRLYRACVRCRSRKIKCDLNSVGIRGKAPCLKCSNEGYECVLAGSRRGGDFAHQRPRHATRNEGRSSVVESSQNFVLRTEATVESNSGQDVDQSIRPSDGPEEQICDELQNPLDALQILARVASNNEGLGGSGQSSSCTTGLGREVNYVAMNSLNSRSSLNVIESDVTSDVGLDGYHLVRVNVIDRKLIDHLLQQ